MSRLGRLPQRERIFLGFGAAMLLVGLGACHGRARIETRSTSPDGNEAWLTDTQVKEARLKISPVQRENVGGEVAATGKVTFDDLRVSHVYSPVTGRVVRILANPGDRVSKGAPLAVIESPDVGSAFSDLAKAQADFVATQHDVRRQKELLDAHAGSQRDYEQASDNFARAGAELERARQKAQLLHSGRVDRVNQEYTLQALIDGEVVARNLNPGAEVQGQYSGGQAVELFTIGELDRVWGVGEVFEIDLPRVKIGARVVVHVVAYPEKSFEGKVDFIADTLDPATHTTKVRCAIQNPERNLKPEMYATLSIAVDERRALAIPRTALLRLGDQTMVFVDVGKTQDGKRRFARRPVAVREDAGGQFLPIINGLKEGEPLVVSGAILLSGMLQ